MVMKYMKFVLFFVCVLGVAFSVSAKDETYGNITLRSKANTPSKATYQQRYGAQNNANGYYLPAGYPTDNSNGMAGYESQLEMKPYTFDAYNAYNNVPFDDSSNSTRAVRKNAFGDPNGDPLHPGVPVGDALPFMVLLAGIYVYIINKKYKKEM